jgi:hypothetical protein
MYKHFWHGNFLKVWLSLREHILFITFYGLSPQTIDLQEMSLSMIFMVKLTRNEKREKNKLKERERESLKF